jgi:hypothetical protein
MNRENMGKALHRYLFESKLLPASKVQKNWGGLKEEAKEEYRKLAESLSQDFIYGGKYELSPSHLDEDQIIYNGLFTCVFPHRQNGRCHLLLLRSRERDTDNEENVQKMAIVTQTPGSLFAIQRQIEQIATLVMDFFKYPTLNHPQDDITITPENTTFIEYIPYSALNDTTDITETPTGEKGRGSDISIVRFQWEEEENTHRVQRNYKASNPSWKDTSIPAVNVMIQNL